MLAKTRTLLEVSRLEYGSKLLIFMAWPCFHLDCCLVLHLNGELDVDDKEASEALLLTLSNIIQHYPTLSDIIQHYLT
jgi:hypothetical protein